MKKIIEAELKNRVNSLREYITSLDEQATINPKRVTLNPDGTTSGGIAPAPAVTADPVVQVSTPTSVPVDPRDGPTGQALARMGISKQNRLDQAFVDKMLGVGKYKAGSAESNLALLKTKPPVAQPSQIDKAPPVVAVPKYQYQTYPPKDMSPADQKRLNLPESVSYADDQTLARIVSLGRR